MPERQSNDAESIPRVAVVIEDDQDIRELLVTVFQQSGFMVHSAENGLDGVAAVAEHCPTVVTLDLGLPDIDGFEVARRVRLKSDCYIIMLTARSEEADTLMGLDSGADDFITKPFRPRELRARIAAMLRRPRAAHAASPEAGDTREQDEHPAPATAGGLLSDNPDAIVLDGLRIDRGTRMVWCDQQEVDLTRTEFELLSTLMESGRIVRTKADLVRYLRAEQYDTGAFISEADERAIEVHVGNLRRKLGQSAQAPRWVETVRGVGYRMAAER